MNKQLAKEREVLVYLVKTFRVAIIILSSLLVGVAISALSGCSSTPHNKPPTLADAKWSKSNEIIHNVCIDEVLKAARNTPNLTDDLLPEAKAMYWECVIDLQGAI